LLDTKLEIEPKGKYFYPDVVYTCHAQDMNWGKKNHISHPVLVAEVLSPSTEDHDRNGKFKAYLAMPGLLYYLLLSQDQYSVEVYERQPDGNWIYSRYDSSESLIDLPLIGIQLHMEELYQKVPLEGRESD
jgi:Uma2 family endonuclease